MSKEDVVFIVKNFPKDPGDCPLSKWEPYPPIVREPGYYRCKLGGECRIISDKSCLHMEEMGEINE